MYTIHHKIETLIHCNTVEEIKHRLGYEGSEAPKRFIDLLSKDTQKIFEESVVEVKSYKETTILTQSGGGAMVLFNSNEPLETKQQRHSSGPISPSKEVDINNEDKE